MNNRVTAPGISTGSSAIAAPTAGRAQRILVFAYGTITYAITLGIFVYAAGFIGNFGVPKAMDSGRQVPLAQAIAIDALLLGVFAIQHSVMARGWFKRWLTRFIPRAAERSTIPGCNSTFGTGHGTVRPANEPKIGTFAAIE